MILNIESKGKCKTFHIDATGNFASWDKVNTYHRFKITQRS